MEMRSLNEQTKLEINADRLSADFEALAEIGATVDGGISRLALSNEDLQARAWLASAFEAAGMEVHDDDAGNLSGILQADRPDAQTLLVGSHLDSVPNGGRYDGTIGVLAALECARTIREAGMTLPFNLEVVDFTDEEGCWQSLFGSRALTGTLQQNYSRDADVNSGPFRAALFRAGIRPTDVHCAERDPETIAGYLELHIEQSNSLDQTGVRLGVVTGIVGRITYDVTFYGEASHSGTTRLESRRDALKGAAAFITQAHELIESQYPDGVINCGNVTVEPGAFNIIPSEACVTFECRHTDRDTLRQMSDDLIALAEQVAGGYHLATKAAKVGHMPTARMAGQMVMLIEQAAANLGTETARVNSFAGHDAQILSNFTPTGMIFIPSVDGVSHSPREFSLWEDVINGTEVLLETILLLAERYS